MKKRNILTVASIMTMLLIPAALSGALTTPEPDYMATEFVWSPSNAAPDYMATEFVWRPSNPAPDYMATEFLWVPMKSEVLASK
jgi:hypothetical protein